MKLSELHTFWFDEIKIDDEYYQRKVFQWFFGKDPLFDSACKDKFSSWLDKIDLSSSFLETLSSRDYLALVILLDQIPRNSFRGSKMAFVFDSIAQNLCLNALGTSREKELLLPEKMFLYMPLEHAEDKEIQKLSVEKFREFHEAAPAEIKKWTLLALEKAHEHQATILEFGSFIKRVNN